MTECFIGILNKSNTIVHLKSMNDEPNIVINVVNLVDIYMVYISYILVSY